MTGSNNYTSYSLKLLTELFTSFLFFPVWWYTKGLLKTALLIKDFLREKEETLAFFVWVKNIFTPMYGEHDFAGVLISVVVRIFQIIARGLIMLFFLTLSIFLFVIWLIAPVFVVLQIVLQLIPG